MKKVFILASSIAILSACTSLNRSMRESNSRLNLTKSDFTLSEQVSGIATSTKILMIDWSRLFKSTSGNVESPSAGLSLATLPVIGTLINDATAGYSLYEMMNNNPGYDVILYPQYETKVVRPIGLGFIIKTTTVKSTARLGKLK